MKQAENLNYRVKLVWDDESGGDVYIRRFPRLKIDIPEKFGGKSRAPCPDELFFSAIGGCLLTTFLYFKKKLELELRELEVIVQGTLDYAGRRGYRIADIGVVMSIDVDEEEGSKAEECVELTREYCHLIRSLEKGIPIRIESEIRTSEN